MSCKTQPKSHIFHYSRFMFVNFFGFFVLVVPQPFCAETNTYCRIYNSILTSKTDTREDANNHKVIWRNFLSRSLNFPDGLRPLRFLFLDALLPLSVGGSEDGAVFSVVFARSWPSCWILHWSPLDPESTTNSLSSGSFVEAAGNTQSPYTT